MNAPPIKICAIYTRKSTGEGLDQSFNSLDAQREACEAYVKSQAHEGWKLLEDRFDDGGISGGTMERPGLKKLMEMIEKGLVDTIVVYKVDRLTRSLADFARIVDVLDDKGASFVSVTQQFNTTNSMGRLTLNVLLSFAQFEREVTAERIRDKFRASKEKGMWMGGHPPLGYDIKDRRLVVNEEEAETVRMIFRRYVEEKSAMRILNWLEEHGIRSKARITAAGNHYGGNIFTRGALYALLSNKTYLGKVDYKGTVYEGEHEAIIVPDLWDQAQKALEANRHKRPDKNTPSRSFLKSLMFDDRGQAYSPSHAVKQGKRYRYYQTKSSKRERPTRLPAPPIEEHVVTELRLFFQNPKRVQKELEAMGQRLEAGKLLLETTAMAARLASPFDSKTQELANELVTRVEVSDDGILIELNRTTLAQHMTRRECRIEPIPKPLTLESTTRLAKSGSGVKLIVEPNRPDRGKVTALRSNRNDNRQWAKTLEQAHAWLADLTSGRSGSFADIALRDGTDTRHVARTVRLAFLAPEVVEDILNGRSPIELSVHKLLRLKNFPERWPEQHNTFCKS